jgi:transposase
LEQHPYSVAQIFQRLRAEQAFSFGEATEHFLAAHQNALQFFGRVPAKIIVDNPKTAVLKHPVGRCRSFIRGTLDFAAHYGFEPRACNVRRPNENGVWSPVSGT